MFSFTYKKITDVWKSEEDSMKKISKMADFNFSILEFTVYPSVHNIYVT